MRVPCVEGGADFVVGREAEDEETVGLGQPFFKKTTMAASSIKTRGTEPRVEGRRLLQTLLSIAMAYRVMVYMGTACIGTVYIVMAYVVMACAVMAYMAMAYIIN